MIFAGVALGSLVLRLLTAWALPFAVPYPTVTTWLLGLDRLAAKMAAKVPASPSVTDTSPMLNEGTGSSLIIAPTAWPSAIAALVAPCRSTTKVSSAS